MLKNSRNKLAIALKKSRTISFAGVVLLMLVYLVSTNYAATQSFELNSLGTEIKDLGYQTLLLNVKASELQSIERIENASKSLSLVQTKNVYYLLDTKEIVALK